MKEWRYQFPSHILERGYDYYYHGKVSLLWQDDYHYQFSVVGRQSYQVLLEIKNDTVVNAKCNCPYHQKHHLCKHITAAILYLENRETNHLLLSESPEMVLNQLDLATKEALLLEILRHDEKMFNQAKILAKIEESNFSQEARKLNDLFMAYDFQRIGITELEKEIGIFIEQHIIFSQDTKLAFSHLKHLLLRLKTLTYDTKYDSTIFLESMALNALEQLLKTNPSIKSEAFDLLIADYAKESYCDFCFEHFHTQPYLNRKLSFLNFEAKKIESFDAWQKDYYLERNAYHRLQVLYDLKDRKAYQSHSHTYWHYPKIREFWLMLSIEKHEYYKAIQILQDCATYDQNNPALILKEKRMLVDLYEKTDSERYFAALKEMLFHEDPGDFDDYLRYKAICPNEDWPMYLKQLLKTPMEDKRLLDILYAEELYDLLLEKITTTNNNYYLDRIADELAKICPQQLANAYATIAWQKGRVARIEEEYQQVSLILIRMQKYPYGELFSQKVISRLQRYYPKKRALMKELAKIITSEEE